MPDPFLDDPDGSDGNALQQAREHIARLEKDLKERDKDLRKATESLAEADARFRTQAATAFGLSDRQARAFLKENPDGEINADTVRAWAEDLGLSLGGSTPPAQPAEEPAADAPAFQPVAGNDPPISKMAWPEYKKILLEDPQRALALANQGLVEGVDPD